MRLFAEAVIQEAQRTDAIDDCDVRSAPSVELCSTTEMLEVFSEFYDGDTLNTSSISVALHSSTEGADLTSQSSIASVLCAS